MTRTSTCSLILILMCVLVPALDGQVLTAAAPEPAPPVGSLHWSPLRLGADLPRMTLGSILQTPSLLIRPSPTVGLFWNVGNPAGLPDEQQHWNGYQLEHGGSNGDYRRPLDPGSKSRTRLSVEGWSDVHARAAAAGRVVLDRTDHRAPAAADVITPYASSPLIVLDTGATDLGSTAARVEGAIGIGVGHFAFGAALGFEGGETRTIASPVPRTIRSTVPATVVGLTWRPFGTNRVRVGVHGRWQETTQRINLFSLAAATRVYQVTGYGEPAALDVSGTFYRRDIEAGARGLGVGVASQLMGARLVLFAELADVEQRHSSIEINDPPMDIWTADIVRMGIVVQRTLLENRLHLSSGVERVELRGRTCLSDVEQHVAFAADETRFDISLDARLYLEQWTLGLRARWMHESRFRVDSTIGAASDIRAWTTMGAVELARKLPAGISAAVGAGVGVYRAAGSLPVPAQLGAVYRTYVGPELALQATDATATILTATLRWEPWRNGAGFFLHAGTRAMSPTGTRQLPLTPVGNRREWSVQMGLTVGKSE